MNQRSVRRHLLAICTFVVPLAALAWLARAEFGRQADQVRAALDREGLQFLRTAAQALEQRFDQLLPTLAQESEDLLHDHAPAATVRHLRERGFAAVLDLVLLRSDGRLLYPEPQSQRLALPFHRDAGADDPTAGVLQAVDLLLTHARFDDAARQLRAALADLDRSEPQRRRIELLTWRAALSMRLATVEQKLGRPDTAAPLYQQTIAAASELRATGRGIRVFDRVLDPEPLVLGLLAEVALAELAPSPQPRRDLLLAIADGRHDQLGDSLLQAVADRLAAAAALDRKAADELLAEVDIHLHARAFAADFDRFLRETVRRRLRARSDHSPDADALDLRQVITAGSPSSLLLLRPAAGAEVERCDWVGLRLDLGQLLAGAVEPFVRGDGSFVLAVADGDDLPIVAAPPAPADFAPPALASHGMMLRAYPADRARYLADARAADRGAALLLLGLFVVAATGALWLWRSVSRESELAALKVDLVSRVSHELKTPLALISLYGETLALGRARDADQAAKFGGVIARESGRLTAMIQRILDFSRQQAGTLHYEPEPTDLATDLAAVAATYAPHLESKGAHLGVALEPGLRTAVDRTALASVVVNLLDNAAKYGSEAEADADVQVRLELHRRGDRAEIDVLDRGRGVPAHERDKVFDSFYRASNAGEVRGAGLGLSLVRHFATAHGGSVEALPRPGGGSIFRLRLPIDPASPTQA